MKRELDSAVEAVPDPSSSARATEASFGLVQVDEGTSCKRVKVTQVNGYIVYTRVKKRKINGCNGLLGALQNKGIKRLNERKRDAIRPLLETVNDGRPGTIGANGGNRARTVHNSVPADELVESFIVDTVIEESSTVDETDIVGRLLVESISMGDGLGVERAIERSELDERLDPEILISTEVVGPPESSVAGEAHDIPMKALKRFRRASLKATVEPEESFNSELQTVENDSNSNFGAEGDVEDGESMVPRKNLELKMSKKIAINKCPMTVKELFDTGLLDGVSVVYMGTINSKSSGLRGIIQDGGILCSCSLCKGCRVVPPSQFEIHACKQYKRASQYICFENGKSLLDVLRACRRRPLHALEATIQNFVSALPEDKVFTCRRCKGSFPVALVGQIGPLCNSCVELKKSQHEPARVACAKPRPREKVVISESSESTSVGILLRKRSPRITARKSQESVVTSDLCGSPLLDTPSKDGTLQNQNHRKKRRKSLELDVTSNSQKSSALYSSLQNKNPWKMAKKSAKPGLLPKPGKNISVHGSSGNKAQLKITKKSKKYFFTSKSVKNVTPYSYPKKSVAPQTDMQSGNQIKMNTKDQRLHKLVFEYGGLPDGTEVAYYARGQRLLEGYKKGCGIFCHCCNCTVSPSQFEAHAGWASRRKPYAYIYTSNGVSLHELAISISRGRHYSAKDNDKVCIICADGGNLLLCDGCPRAFHIECASLSTIPRGRWYCKYCQNLFVKERFVEYNANAVAAGRVLGVNAIDQITRRCIRIVKSVEAEVSGCVLCRCSDFSKSGFGPRTILLCDQCEKEFHVGCLRSHKMADLRELPKGKWFCCVDCNRIHSILQKLLVRGAERLPNSLLDVMKKKYEQKGLEIIVDVDVRWRLLSGKIASPETRLLLSQAVAIFHECFDPIVDATTGRDLIPCMVYGRNLKVQEFGGMYCAVLTVNSSVVSAGIVRIFGQETAELPLVATSRANHGMGYFKLLFSCIEKLLVLLKVKNIMLPAAEEAESIWTNKFGFTKLEADQLGEYRKICSQIVTFKGTSLLQKEVPAAAIADRSTGQLDYCNEFLSVE